MFRRVNSSSRIRKGGPETTQQSRDITALDARCSIRGLETGSHAPYLGASKYQAQLLENTSSIYTPFQSSTIFFVLWGFSLQISQSISSSLLTMRLFNAIMVAFIGLAIATPIAMEDELVERTHQNKGFSLDKRPTIPSVSGLKFNIDGTTAYFAGTNTY